MFSHILFLILIIMTLSYAPEAEPLVPPGIGLIWGAGLYVVLLVAIVIQGKIGRRRMTPLVNTELLVFFLIYHFVLGAQRLYAANSLFILALVSLGLFFFALFVHHTMTSSAQRAIRQVRFLTPFVIPFLFFDLVIDLIPGDGENPVAVGLTILASLVFLVFLLAVFPYVIQKIWGCKPLPESKLKERLDSLCERTGFRHAGMKTWPVMRHAMTAGILGVARKWRYVMFTEGLICQLSPEETEAVLAHEIGHSRHHHLVLFPLILAGLFILLGLWGAISIDPLERIFRRYPEWSVLEPLLFFIPYAIIVLLYFRFVFGYFSRIFERQADLFVFQAGVSVESMIGALDRIATLSGNIHHLPSWHHYGIGQRISFLHRAAHSPQLIIKHHQRVKRALWFYAGLVLLLLLVTVFYPLFL